MTKEEAEWITEGIIDALIMDGVSEKVFNTDIVRLHLLSDYLIQYLQEVELKEKQ